VNGFITLLQSVRHFPISEAEKRVLYNIINNTQRDSSNKIKRLKKFLGFTKNKMDGEFSTESVETDSLVEKGFDPFK
jgi:hypothetical protein